jgi:hypothetical protein
MLPERDHSRTIDRQENPGKLFPIFKMVDPLRYCGGSTELDKFLKTL